jgi:hypothetical protein
MVNNNERNTIMNTTKNKPIITLRDRSLKASIWRQLDGKGKAFYPVTITRTYKDDEGNYHDTDRLLGDELLRMARLCERAYDMTLEYRQQDRQNDVTTPATGVAQ